MELLLFLFDGGTLNDASEATPDGEKIAEVRFFKVADMVDVMPARLARRISTAVSDTGEAYAEHGVNISETSRT